MSALSLATVTRVWAQSLADLDPVPEDKLQILQQVCKADAISDRPTKTSGDVLQALMPLVKFLEDCNGKHATELLPRIAAKLQQVPRSWDQMEAGPLRTQADFLQLMLSFRRMMSSPGVPTAVKQQLSSEIANLLVALLELAQQQELPVTPSWLKSGCNLLLRALTRTGPFSTNPQLPLLPEDAMKVLAWIDDRLVGRDVLSREKSQGTWYSAETNGNAQAVAANVAGGAVSNSTGALTAATEPSGGAGAVTRSWPMLLEKDDKLYLLASKLAVTAFANSGSTGSNSNGVSTSSTVSSNSSMVRRAKDLAVLGRLLSWSSNLVKGALERLIKMQGPVDDASAPGVESAYAATQLASTCVYYLLSSMSSHQAGSVGQEDRPLKKQVEELIDVALSVAETAVLAASSESLSLEEDRDKVLFMSARILTEIKAFVAAVCQTSTAPEQLELASRIRVLLLGAARLAGDLASTPGRKAAAVTGAADAESQQGVRLRHRSGKGRRSGLRGGSAVAKGMHKDLSAASLHTLSKKSLGMAVEVEQMGDGYLAATSGSSPTARQSTELVSEHPWSWDVTQPLTAGVLDPSLRSTALATPGLGPHLLARAVAEVLVEALAVSWTEGQPTTVRALMMLPPVMDTPQEYMAMALAAGRLYTKLDADPSLGQLLLPLLADSLTSNQSSCAADMAAALVCSLEGMAVAGAQHKDGSWVYEQALQLLMKLYREPTVTSRQLLSGRDAPPAVRGLLADALCSLAEGLTDSSYKQRQQLRLKLLLLFSDVGSRTGTGVAAGPMGGGSQDQVLIAADLGELLPAVSAAAEGLLPGTLRLLGGSSTSRMSMQEIRAAQREDASTTRLFRNLWLYCALLRLVHPAVVLEAASGAGSSAAAQGGVNAEWQEAAGRIALVTPLMVVGTDSYIETDMVERLKVELGEQLQHAGKLGDFGRIQSALQQLVAPVEKLPQPTEKVLLAFIYAVAMAELSRAALAPLPDADDDGVVACPVSVTLGYLQGVLPEGIASAWLVAIARRAFQLYVARLRALHRTQDEACQIDAASGAPALAYAEQLACALIQHLGDAAGAVDGSTPVVAALSDDLLASLLTAFPALYHSRPCYSALFSQLQHEEGDVPMGQVQASRNGIVWDRTKRWVEVAASLAPATTEALLHSFLCSSAIVGSHAHGGAYPGAMSRSLSRSLSSQPLSRSLSAAANEDGNLDGPPHPSAPTSAVAVAAVVGPTEPLKHPLHRDPGSSSDGSITSSSRQSFNASQAAFRRAADLLRICGQARNAQQQTTSDGAYEGTLAFARKLHYSGHVQGLMDAEEGPLMDVGAQGGMTAHQLQVAQQIAYHLESLLQRPSTPQSALDDAHLLASALLAVQPQGYAGSQQGQRLLKALASAPLQRMAPATMKLAIFSWGWVSAESPELLVPLISSISDAWVWTVDQRRGLFSGQLHRAGTHEEVEAATQQERQGYHDEKMLQAVSAHHMWLAYLIELWSIIRPLGDGRSSAAQHQFGHLLHASLQDPSVLTHHPAAVGAYFRLLQLGLVYSRSLLLPGVPLAQQATPTLLLFDQILRAGLLWFSSPPRYFSRLTRLAAAEQVASLQQFRAQVQSLLKFTGQAWPTAFSGTSSAGAGVPHPTWGTASPAVDGYCRLLCFLVDEEVKRLQVWTDPISGANAYATTPSVNWHDHVQLAWQVDPKLAICLLSHFPMANAARAELENLVLKHAHSTAVQSVPAGALLLVRAKASSRGGHLKQLVTWKPGTAEQGLELLSGEAGSNPDVRGYAIKCLFNEPPERVVFFLPQLVQLLRGDDGAIRQFFLTSAAHSDVFAHQLMWALESESRPPDEAFNPEVKRSGWQPPKDTGLWQVAGQVQAQIVAQMNPQQREYWQAEDGYFQQVTSLSGYLYPFSKDERRNKLQEKLAEFGPPREDLYLPTNPDCRVVNHIPGSGACMQSAAKVPILVAFNVQKGVPPVNLSSHAHHPPAAAAASSQAPISAKMACIFKVGDDIRQDVLAIQVISLLRDAFKRAGLGLYLRPYGCLPTGYECGIIEVVPNTKSRAALGELSDRGLYDIFSSEFGAPGSSAFEKARTNFIVSEAAYAVASFLLQAKDRHNGNIMLDDQGHIVHIDFGFILEISPGGNLGFESAAFKLSHEMTQVLDPGGKRTSPQFRLFEDLVVRAYLAARTVAEPIIATVALMADSGLPCFSRGQPVPNLRKRFRLDLNDAQAAAFMRDTIADSYDKWTTGFYDYIQSLQNKIPY